MRRTDAWSWMDDALPIVAMLMLTCSDMAVLTIVKAAMNDGMSSFVYVIYHNALGTLVLLPFFIFHILRKVDRPQLTFHILFRFFILGLLGLCLFQILWYLGVSYSSPTMASAILNLFPGITFLIAVCFRMEKIDIKSSSSVAKLLGTMMAISGAMVFTFYQGPEIFRSVLTLNASNQTFLSQPPKWIFGSLIIFISGTFCCLWSVLHGVYSTVARNSVLTWCLRKKGPIFASMFSPLSIVVATIMGVTFLGDSLHLGSVIGTVLIAVGFYSAIWGDAKEKNKIIVVMGHNVDVSDEPESSDQTAHLLSP